MRIGIGRVNVQSGSANFADYWIKPNYAVSLQELSGSISGLSSDPKSRAKVDLNGSVDRYAPAQIRGEMNLLSAALFTDMHVKFDGVEMTSVTPYSGHFAGYQIEKGKLSIDVDLPGRESPAHCQAEVRHRPAAARRARRKPGRRASCR